MYFPNIQKNALIRGQSPMCVDSTIVVFSIPDNVVINFSSPFKHVELWAKPHAMDKVMKMLQIEVAKLSAKDVIPIVHYNLEGRPIGNGQNSWLLPLEVMH
jgi:hypothetical protein